MGHDLRVVVEADPVLRAAAINVATDAIDADTCEALDKLDDAAREGLRRWVGLVRVAARKEFKVGVERTEEERDAWDAFDDYERNLLTRWARDQGTAELRAHIKRDLRANPESARRRYATMSRDLRRVLGVERALQVSRAPCGHRHRRASGARPLRRRGSRRSTSAPTRGDPDDGDSDPPGALGPQAWREAAEAAP